MAGAEQNDTPYVTVHRRSVAIPLLSIVFTYHSPHVDITLQYLFPIFLCSRDHRQPRCFLESCHSPSLGPDSIVISDDHIVGTNRKSPICLRKNGLGSGRAIKLECQERMWLCLVRPWLPHRVDCAFYHPPSDCTANSCRSPRTSE